MAATLALIKSRMLLPSYHSSEAGEIRNDPRGDLIEALREHKRIKDAADRLADRSWLDSDVFTRAAAAARGLRRSACAPPRGPIATTR